MSHFLNFQAVNLVQQLLVDEVKFEYLCLQVSYLNLKLSLAVLVELVVGCQLFANVVNDGFKLGRCLFFLNGGLRHYSLNLFLLVLEDVFYLTLELLNFLLFILRLLFFLAGELGDIGKLDDVNRLLLFYLNDTLNYLRLYFRKLIYSCALLLDNF